MRMLTALPTTTQSPPVRRRPRGFGPAGRPGTERLVLEVVLTDPAHAERAGAVLAPLSDGTVVADGDVLRLTVRGRDGTIVRAVRLLHEAGLGARDLILRRPSLAPRAA